MSQPVTSPVRSVHMCGIEVLPPQAQDKSQELRASEATAARNKKHIEAAVLAAHSALWDNDKILDFSFFGGTPRQHTKVEDVIDEWMWYANVHFKRSSPNNPDATLRIAFDPLNGSWSYVGNAALDCEKTKPTMNLGWISDTNTLTKKERGVILHEFGHVLGLMHEHESPARSGVIKLKEAEIIQYYSETQGWDEAKIRKQILDVYSKDSVSSYSQFDPTSIMMYFMPAAMNEGGVDIPEVTELSMLDIAFVVANYPRDRPHPRAHKWTPQFALMATGASAEAVKMYMEETSVDEKRVIFGNEIAELRLHEAKRQQLHPEREVPHASSDKSNAVEHALQIPEGAFKQPGKGGDAVNQTQAEKVQDSILSLLLGIAPKILLAPNSSAAGVTLNGVQHAPLDPNNLTLDHPVIQHGLMSFFTQLTSNELVKKAMVGAVDLATGALKKRIGAEDTVQNQTYAEKVQNSIFNQLLDIAPKSLLVPATGTTLNGVQHAPLDPNTLTLDHPVVQHGLMDFFKKLASNDSVKKAMAGAVDLATGALKQRIGVENAIQNQTQAEKVQDGILSLLLDIAPKILLAPNAPATGSTLNGVQHAPLDPKTLTLDHPVVQHGLMNFFTHLASNELVKKAMVGAVDLATGALKKRIGVDSEGVVQNQTQAEKVQDSIFNQLLSIAPKSLLAPEAPATGSIVNGVQHAPLDPNTLTLDHPVVQHGLMDFFKKLASNDSVKKAMAGAVDLATGAIKKRIGVDLEGAVQNQTHAEKVQDSIFTQLLNIAPKSLLAPEVSTTGSVVNGIQHAPLDPNTLTLDHPVVQHGLMGFFKKLASNDSVKKAIAGAVDFASGALKDRIGVDSESVVQNQTHAEKVQDSIFTQLLNIAPKALLAPEVSATGSVVNGTQHAPLDPNTLTLDHPVVQHGLMGFFKKLASNDSVKKAMTGAVDLASDALRKRLEVQQGVTTGSKTGAWTAMPPDQLAHLVSLVVVHPQFKRAVLGLPEGWDEEDVHNQILVTVYDKAKHSAK